MTSGFWIPQNKYHILVQYQFHYSNKYYHHSQK